MARSDRCGGAAPPESPEPPLLLLAAKAGGVVPLRGVLLRNTAPLGAASAEEGAVDCDTLG